MNKYYKYVGSDSRPNSWFVILVSDEHVESADKKALTPGTVVHTHNCDIHQVGTYFDEWIMGVFEECEYPTEPPPSCWDEAEKIALQVYEDSGGPHEIIAELKQHYTLIKR